MFHIVLFEPEIPPNTGNIMRLCANMGSALHLIHPLGFQLDEKKLRRAGLDYRDFADVVTHDNYAEFLQTVAPKRVFACTTKGKTVYTEAHYNPGDALLFGPESRGLPASIRDDLPASQLVRIPMRENSRSLNLSNAVAIIAYEAWRQNNFR